MPHLNEPKTSLSRLFESSKYRKETTSPKRALERRYIYRKDIIIHTIFSERNLLQTYDGVQNTGEITNRNYKASLNIFRSLPSRRGKICYDLNEPCNHVFFEVPVIGAWTIWVNSYQTIPRVPYFVRPTKTAHEGKTTPSVVL